MGHSFYRTLKNGNVYLKKGEEQWVFFFLSCSGFITGVTVVTDSGRWISLGGTPFHTTFAPFPPAQLIASPIPTPIPGRVPPQFGVGPFPQLYVLSYPSPPVSPTGYYGPASPSHIAIVPPDWGVDYLSPPPPLPTNTQPLNQPGVHSAVA